MTVIYFTVTVKLEEQIKAAIDILKRGGVIAFPTDTVYGLGASAFDERAVERIFEVKRRPHSLSLPLLLSDITQLAGVLDVVSPLIKCLAQEFLPGGLTIIGHKSANVSDAVTAGGDTVAVRIPNHHVPIALIDGLGNPIVGTSANISGKPSALEGSEVRCQIGGSIDFIVDDGVGCIGGIESTIVDATTDEVKIIREGAIPAREIMEACTSVYGGEK